ncbi:MAG: hypothetical protein OJI67_04120, partial [Prosthecobacter sp.]|nr:hypothetical protein [Prosthecobacter sp.]
VSPLEFLPTFGRKFGDMFRRVFYGDSQPARGYQPPQGYSQQGRSLDTAPPSYQSQYGYGQPAYPSQPSYRQPTVQGQAPQYQTPPPPQNPAAQSPAMPQGNRMSSPAAPRMSLKSPQTPKPSTKTPPKNYTPPTITKKSTPKLEEMPPPNPDKSDKTAAAKTEYYPLPGAQPKTEASKPTTKTEKTVGNNGAFLKGKRASKEGRVISPYPPYQELDVTGLSSGSLALDPTTQKVFEVP